jgi:PAS domain S-box-containing protein
MDTCGKIAVFFIFSLLTMLRISPAAALTDIHYINRIVVIGFLISLVFVSALFFKRWKDSMRREVESGMAALRISEAKYRGLVETSTDAIISANEKGEIILWNKAAERIFGYSEDEVRGNPLTIIIPEEYRRRHKRRFKKYLEAGGVRVLSRTVEVTGLRKNGTKFPVEISLSKQKVPEGYIFTAIVRDISKRRSLEKELERKHAELRKAYARISALHRVERAISQPLTLDEVMKVALDEVLNQLKADAGGIYLLEEDGETLTLHSPMGASKEFVKRLKRLKVGEGISGMAAREGRAISVNISKYPSPEYEAVLIKEGLKSVVSAPIFSRGKVIGAVTLGARREKGFGQEDLELLGSIGLQLGTYIENSRLHQDLLRAYEGLRSVDELKSNLIARVSHELRTPITIAKGALQLAALETKMETKDKLIKMAVDALIRQNMIVGDLLEASMLEKRGLSHKLAAVDLKKAVSLSVDELKSQASKKNISVRVKIPTDLPMVWGEFDKLLHVLRNLLHNAIKFNHEGGEVLIEAQRKKDVVTVCIKDTGIGIPEDKLEKIFDRFYQVDSGLTRRYSGTGMGLAIAKEIVERQGGHIWVESEEGRGSRFYFTLSVAEASSREVLKSGPPS